MNTKLRRYAEAKYRYYQQVLKENSLFESTHSELYKVTASKAAWAALICPKKDGIAYFEDLKVYNAEGG